MGLISKGTPAPEGQLLRTLRIRADITQNELGARMGLTGAMVGGWETGQWRAAEPWIRAVCDVLGADEATLALALELRAQPWLTPKKRARALKSLVTPEPVKVSASDIPRSVFSSAA